MSGDTRSGLKPIDAVNMPSPDEGGAMDGMCGVGRLLGGTLVPSVVDGVLGFGRRNACAVKNM